MGRDHDWNRSIYPACTSKDNYYFVRMGSNIGASKEEMEQIFHKLLSAHLTTFECTYVGTDANYSIFDALVECLRAHGPQYGLMGWQVNGTQYWVRAENLSYSGAVHTHTYVSTVTEPTCMMGGYTTHTCICGDTYTDSSVTALGHNMGSWQTVKEATCAKEGSKKQTCQRSGCDYSVTDKIPATGNHTYTDQADTSCNVCGYKRTEAVETVPVYRFYNPYTNEHLLVSDEGEKNTLVNAGWTLEGVAWNAPKEGSPVYRLYNPDDWHTYTSSEEEMQAMVAAGWSLDGPVSCTATKENGRPVYRLFNPYEKTNFHLFTAGVEERDMLVNAGWILEGIAWYAAP